MTKRRTEQDLDELYMMECLHLAQRRAGYVSPNPMVGAVLVKNGAVIGRGFHKRFGGPHAEVYAIRSAKISPQGATLYVNLEPCNFYGKTPPCTDLIIKSKIKRVVVGSRDPNPLVSGKAIRELRRKGIEVITGVLEEDCKKLNEAFCKFITTRLPFVALKIAQTLDGKIADVTGNSQWLTNVLSRKLVHKLRARYDAVLVGAGTVNKDNPRLTVRHNNGRNPLRVIIDRRFSVNLNSHVFSSEAKTIVFTSKLQYEKNPSKRKKLAKLCVEVIPMSDANDGAYNLKEILKILGSRGIASVLVEGGATMFSLFLEKNLADKVFFFIAPKLFGKGLDSFSQLTPRRIGHEIFFKRLSVANIEDDVLLEAYLRE